jgi:leucine dehydrogenase
MGGGGDPSPVTAYGVYMGMKAAAKHTWGSENLKDKKVVVQGVGHVGENLVRNLIKEGAKVSIIDINQDALKRISAETGASVLENLDFYGMDMDIYAPCALGATLNSDNIAKLKCAVIAGAANNQLADESTHGKMITDKGITYAPDFVINAGGLINVYSELTGYNRDRALQQTEKIYDFTLEIFKKASAENIPTYLAANRLAEKRISDIGKVRLGI